MAASSTIVTYWYRNAGNSIHRDRDAAAGRVRCADQLEAQSLQVPSSRLAGEVRARHTAAHLEGLLDRVDDATDPHAVLANHLRRNTPQTRRDLLGVQIHRRAVEHKTSHASLSLVLVAARRARRAMAARYCQTDLRGTSSNDHAKIGQGELRRVHQHPRRLGQACAGIATSRAVEQIQSVALSTRPYGGMTRLRV